MLVDRSRSTADFAERKLRKLVEAYQRWVTEQRLKERGVPVSVLSPVTMAAEDVASKTQLFGTCSGRRCRCC